MTVLWPNLFNQQKHIAMGVVNITPDSFSDGNQLKNLNTFQIFMESFNCPIVDIGAQSTAPFNSSIGMNEELQRLNRFLLHSSFCLDSQKIYSIDSYRPETMRVVMDKKRGEFIFNDVSGKLDERLRDLLKDFPRLPYIFSHNLSRERNETNLHMKYAYKGDDILGHLKRFFDQCFEFFEKNHLRNPLVLDPCFGFSKGLKDNLKILKSLDNLFSYYSKDQIWLLGISKKSLLKKSLELAGLPNDMSSREYLHYYFMSEVKESFPDQKIIWRAHHPKLLHHLKT